MVAAQTHRFPTREKRSISGRTTTSVFPHLALVFYLPFYLLLSPPHLHANIQSAPRLFPKHEQVDADNVLEKNYFHTHPPFPNFFVTHFRKKGKGRRKEALKNSKKPGFANELCPPPAEKRSHLFKKKCGETRYFHVLFSFASLFQDIRTDMGCCMQESINLVASCE